MRDALCWSETLVFVEFCDFEHFIGPPVGPTLRVSYRTHGQLKDGSMKSNAILCTFLLAICLLTAGNVNAQASDDSAVWSVIERAWQAERRGDSKWIDELLSADFVGWSNDSPAPRDKGSTRRWNIFAAKRTDILEHELYPLSIIVHGDLAIAHYLYSSASKTKGENVKTEHGRYTDVLVRSDGEWKFIAWHGGADDK